MTMAATATIRTLTLELTELGRAHRAEVAELKEALAAAHGELLWLRRSYAITD
jgi:hypothetical protein